MKRTHFLLATCLTGMFASFAPADEPVVSYYKNDYGLNVQLVRVGDHTAYYFSLDEEVCKDRHMIITLRPSVEQDDGALFILCDGKVTEEDAYVGPLRMGLPNGKLATWTLFVEVFKEKQEGDQRLLHSKEKKQYSLEEIEKESRRAAPENGGDAKASEESSQTAPSRQKQQAAVAAVEKLGGKVNYDYQLTRDSCGHYVFDPDAKPKNPNGPHRVVLVSLGDTKAGDDDLKHLRAFPFLENLDLTNTRITGAGLAHLRGLKHLAFLCLWKTRVDDAGLKHLKDADKLWSLILDETDVTDAGLVHLRNLTGLEEWLGLSGTQVTDEGLHHLHGLKKLRHLNLRFTQVTKAGVESLQTALPGTDISFGP